jgi:hypothetical protein
MQGVMPAAATMVTQPMDGETVSDSLPEIKANLRHWAMWIQRASPCVSAGSDWFRPPMILRRSLFLKMTQKVYTRQVTVIVSATVNARKTEARWSFNIGSNEAPK